MLREQKPAGSLTTNLYQKLALVDLALLNMKIILFWLRCIVSSLEERAITSSI